MMFFCELSFYFEQFLSGPYMQFHKVVPFYISATSVIAVTTKQITSTYIYVEIFSFAWSFLLFFIVSIITIILGLITILCTLMSMRPVFFKLAIERFNFSWSLSVSHFSVSLIATKTKMFTKNPRCQFFQVFHPNFDSEHRIQPLEWNDINSISTSRQIQITKIKVIF